MSLKLLFLLSHLDFFPENVGAVSDKHDAGFLQDISQIEEKRSGIWSSNMLVGCCWRLIRETPSGENKRQRKMQ
jgi:hypothetical protein